MKCTISTPKTLQGKERTVFFFFGGGGSLLMTKRAEKDNLIIDG